MSYHSDISWNMKVFTTSEVFDMSAAGALSVSEVVIVTNVKSLM